MTEHEEEYRREKNAEPEAGVREQQEQPTPPPWKVRGPTLWAGDGEHAWIIASFDCGNSSRSYDPIRVARNEANARLAGAAPDLHAACRQALRYLAPNGAETRLEAVRLLRAALAKAEGSAGG